MIAEVGKTALITGASSGIGRELATLFAKDGYNLVLVARSEDKLTELAEQVKQVYGTSMVTVIEKDLSAPEAPQEIYDEVISKNITVNTLVNNAGFGEYGVFATETDIQKELSVIQVNVTSLVHLTKLFLKDMVARNEGKILMLGSIVSIMPNPLMAVYGATKSFIYSFSESLRNEINDTDVSITVLMPPATDTDFFNKAGAMNTVAQEMARSNSPADVAKEGYEALMNGKDKAIAGFTTKLQAAASRVLPNTVVSQATRAQMKDKNEADQQLNRKALALGIGIAAVAIAGIAVITLYNNAGTYQRLKYRYKAKKLAGSAKDTLKSASDSITDTVKNATDTARKAVA
ncbi:SDR family NAD(P)-dependent oxidoreductase [Spirosoma sp. KUDC1026]|uniref:SDR family NAD(P)-dependent oxidoreductase n=1 Tax=Spirosoma sp. KUDC1026 TaxID=2745947 RepID=UPI00159BD942|nr:SDR family oxidoreductase [Spirosoma sp. KUDC1026]QKZ13003.1 SDR family oxidoreductase [Spirosoma sp. KUDC1026]